MNWPQNDVRNLEIAWMPPDGFLYALRQGDYSADGADALLGLLRTFQIPGDVETLPRRFVALLWYLPSFLSWQRERVAERAGDLGHFDQFADSVRNELERILGVP